MKSIFNLFSSKLSDQLLHLQKLKENEISKEKAEEMK